MSCTRSHTPHTHTQIKETVSGEPQPSTRDSCITTISLSPDLLQRRKHKHGRASTIDSPIWPRQYKGPPPRHIFAVRRWGGQSSVRALTLGQQRRQDHQHAGRPTEIRHVLPHPRLAFVLSLCLAVHTHRHTVVVPTWRGRPVAHLTVISENLARAAHGTPVSPQMSFPLGLELLRA